MSGLDGAGENPSQQPRRRRVNLRWAYPEVDSLVDEIAELSALSPAEIRRYSGGMR